MEVYDAVARAATSAGMSLAGLSRALGKPDSYIAGGRSRGSAPRSDTLAAMLGACGYSLVAMPSADVPPGAIVIDRVRARDKGKTAR